MNPTERARRSDAYYRDNVRRRELCDRISFLECDMEELKAENAKLRDGYGSMSREKSQLTVDYSDALYEIDRLKAENEKLLGLVRLAHRYIAESCAVQYPYAPEPVSYLSQLEFERQMRELGVEVDE